MSRLALGLAVAGVLLLGGAGPAAADPAGPGDYRSEVTSVEPGLDGVTVEIVGGDAFLRVASEPGHEVVIPGYEGEPYLRFLADGTVEENQRSPATYLNQDRYGRVDVAGIDAGAEPSWRVVDDDGEIAWHDHRIHWMSPDRRPGVEEGDVVLDWEVPLSVDGAEATVHGTLVLEPGISPLPWIALGIALGGATAALGWARRRSLPVAVVAALAGSVAATIAGWAEWSSQPEGVGASVAVVVVPVVGLLAAVVAGVGLLARKPPLAAVATLASAAALLGWGLLRVDVLTHPVLPTDLPAGLDRAFTVAALALATAAALLALRSGKLALPEGGLADAPDAL